MNTLTKSLNRSISFSLLLLGMILLFAGCNESAKDESTAETEEVDKFQNIIWNVKAIHPEGQTLDIKAIDEDGNPHNVKAIQNSDQDSFLNVRAIVDGKQIPVKIIMSEDLFAPVQAIAPGGATFDVQAITADGEMLDVKGIVRVGSVVIMKAITKDGDHYAVKAISPDGMMNDVKGIKINIQDKEMNMQGVPVHAHVKAMHPAENEKDIKAPKKKRKGKYKSDFKRILWNIKSVTDEGKNLDVKAIDAEGNIFDVKATQDSEQHSFMSIRAFVDGQELPVRIMDSTDEYAPVKAVGNDGTIYDIKAFTEDDVKLDVKGISRSGNIVHVKAINESGGFYGVKAFAPDGSLNDVKGIKVFDRQVELVSQGNSVYAHLRAISQ